jgi:CDP-glucose 4,6-dehydratase
MLDFYKGKRVFITGHTGFKGSWLCKILTMAGAKVMGYALEPPTDPSLFKLANLDKSIKSIIGDVRDLEKLKKEMIEFKPEIVIHMAAQPIVRISYDNPVYTYETNVMGTVNVLEAIRLCDSVKSVVIITTDKVYKNNEWSWGYRETDELNGYDPYSNSKSCAELVTSSYINSFFKKRELPVSTVRAGNVIGGGGFAPDRIIPDCIRAAIKNEQVIIRNPYAIRPFQHVIEPLIAYLMIAEKQYDDIKYAGSYNIGPNDIDCIETGKLTTIFCDKWGSNMTWKNVHDGGPHEAAFLKLDCSKLRTTYNWKPKWDIEHAIEKVVEWTKTYINNGDINRCMEKQINEYMEKESE